jgi:hypothetical protein
LALGVGILALGTGPLLLYVVFGPKDGNPIGLGLLFFFSFPFGIGFAAWGLLLKALGREREKEVAPAHPTAPSRTHPDDW